MSLQRSLSLDYLPKYKHLTFCSIFWCVFVTSIRCRQGFMGATFSLLCIIQSGEFQISVLPKSSLKVTLCSYPQEVLSLTFSLLSPRCHVTACHLELFSSPLSSLAHSIVFSFFCSMLSEVYLLILLRGSGSARLKLYGQNDSFLNGSVNLVSTCSGICCCLSKAYTCLL